MTIYKYRTPTVKPLEKLVYEVGWLSCLEYATFDISIF